MNFIEVAGHLGADAEERFTSSGKRVIGLRIAARVRQNGKDETIWWRVNIWGDRFDKLVPFLKKGTGLIVFGEMMKPEIYTDKMGNPQISLTISAEVIRFSPFGKTGAREQNEGEGRASSPHKEPSSHEREPVGAAVGDDSGFTGDDLPF